jgi:DNA invertase Pin-like site-specific DNA recombinase/uncharacterized protein (UPF0147 family)
MKRYRKREKNQDRYNPWEPPTIPQGAKVGIYGRQSTINQVKNNQGAGDLQIEQLVDLAKRMGIKEEDIILYIENRREDGSIKNASGRLRIDQREGLNALVERIENDEIKAVIVFLEDRLFRDETQIEVNKFILVCQEHNTLVVTPYMTYDFRNPYHKKQFRWKCEQAADFLRDYVKARLQDKKDMFSLQGRYDGRNLAAGYVIDKREKINGEDNPNYKKLIAYPPHAEVTLSIFEQLIQCGGKPKRLYRELKKKAVLYPDFDESVDPHTASKLHLQKVPGGYHISFGGLLYLLTNVTYIGWWVYKGQIKKNNHIAIISDEIFWYAFNLLSDTTPEGEERERERYRPRYQRNNKPAPPALLKDIIQAGNPKMSVYTSYRFSDWYYILKWKTATNTPDMYSILVEHVDEAFKSDLLIHMHNTKDFEAFRALARKVHDEAKQAHEKIDQDIARTERRMQATLVSLTTDPDLPQKTRTALNQIYAELAQKKEELLHLKETGTKPETDIGPLLSYHDLLERLSHQEALKRVFEDMQLLAQATTKQVILEGLSPHFMLLTINWRTPLWGTDTALLWRPTGRAPAWTEAEIEIIKQHYPYMPQADLMQQLPQRSLQGIMTQAHRLGISRKVRSACLSADSTLSYEDIQVMRHYHLSLEELSSDNQVIWLR